nr:thiamine phosphate synthase [Alkalilimnicola ehrlichii]
MANTIRRSTIAGLYVLTDAAVGDHRALAAFVEAVIGGGAQLIQYRDKGDDRTRRQREAKAILAVCRSHGVPLLINDDVELAAVVGADGVHVGKGDASLAQARTLLGPEAIVGVSCYDSLARAQEAAAGGPTMLRSGVSSLPR